MPDAPYKAAERWWAKFINGFRRPSQGIAWPDIESHHFTGEHKYTKLEDYSSPFRKAVEQADGNRKLFPKKEPFIFFTFHGSRGQNARRFFMFEVFPKDTDMTTLLTRLLDKLKDQASIEIPEGFEEEEESVE